MRLLIVWICYLLLPLGLSAQSAPPPKGYRLHQVRRLKPVPLPPGGLLSYRAGKSWGLADSLGRIHVRPAFVEAQLFGNGPFMRIRLKQLMRYHRRFAEWNRGYEVWVNARGEYLLAPMGQAAYKQPDGSLRARPISRHLAEPQYEYELQLGGQEDTALIRRAWMRAHKVSTLGRRNLYPVQYLSEDLYAVEGPSLRWHYRLRALVFAVKIRLLYQHHRYQPGIWKVPLALFRENGRRLTRYKFTSLSGVEDSRICFTAGQGNAHRAGYLNRRGKEVLGPYEKAENFSQNRAVVALPGPDWQHPLYTLIDTTGAHLLPPMSGRLTLPDAAGLLRHEVEQQGQTRWEYLRFDGQPAFPGLYFQRAEPFQGDSAAAVDTTGRAGILRRDGSWQPTP